MLFRTGWYGSVGLQQHVDAAAPGRLGRWWTLAAGLSMLSGLAVAQALTPPAADGAPSTTLTTLPPAVTAQLAHLGIPPSALAVHVAQTGQSSSPRLAVHAQEPMNPASLMKLYTSFAGLALLGPNYMWMTPVWVDGEVQQAGRAGILEGSVYIRGQGDPKLVVEKLWLLLKRLQALGLRDIRGDIVLDTSGLQPEAPPPDAFDADPTRPYNVQADALLINYKAVTLTFRPDPKKQVAWVSVEPALSNVTLPRVIALSTEDCGDVRTAVKVQTTGTQLRFGGQYPASCGVKNLPLAFPGPQQFNASAIEGAWRDLGGRLTGRVREGTAPSRKPPSFLFESPPLSEVVKDLNKYSNNVMAQQLFLTLGKEIGGTGNPSTAREVLTRFAQERTGCKPPHLVIDNGSGLSRQTRTTAHCLAQLLHAAWASPVMPELMAALPIAGVDGTTKKGTAYGRAAGQAHLKTGTLADSTGLAGYVLGRSGRRYVFVGMINHPNASAARPVLENLVQWTVDD